MQNVQLPLWNSMNFRKGTFHLMFSLFFFNILNSKRNETICHLLCLHLSLLFATPPSLSLYSMSDITFPSKGLLEEVNLHNSSLLCRLQSTYSSLFTKKKIESEEDRNIDGS